MTVGAIEGERWGAAPLVLLSGRAYEQVNGDVDRLLGYCLPEVATWGQYRAVIMKYIEDHPESRHLSARMLAGMALQQAFPCDPPG